LSVYRSQATLSSVLSEALDVCNSFTIMRIATLNVQNLRLQNGNRLHGAWDADDPEDTGFDPIDRKLTAMLLRDVNADIVALQEVFDPETLDYFHEHYVVPTGTEPYPQRICLPGNDGRGIGVALLCRRPVLKVKSNASVTPADLGIAPLHGVDPKQPIFRRDCLMAEIGPLTVFVCHFKAPYPDPDKAWNIRRLEAAATRKLIERRFDDPARSLWLILGDLNEPDLSVAGQQRAIAPIETGFAVDLMARLPDAERWTYYDPHSGKYHCPDALLASPALAGRWPNALPYILRKGLGRESQRYTGPRLGDVGTHRPHASDHAAVVIDLEGL
jgi:endonuclease/exonuclease/phosphatase family metal-dependent hydrolase